MKKADEATSAKKTAPKTPDEKNVSLTKLLSKRDLGQSEERELVLLAEKADSTPKGKKLTTSEQGTAPTGKKVGPREGKKSIVAKLAAGEAALTLPQVVALMVTGAKTSDASEPQPFAKKSIGADSPGLPGAAPALKLADLRAAIRNLGALNSHMTAKVAKDGPRPAASNPFKVGVLTFKDGTVSAMQAKSKAAAPSVHPEASKQQGVRVVVVDHRKEPAPSLSGVASRAIDAKMKNLKTDHSDAGGNGLMKFGAGDAKAATMTLRMQAPAAAARNPSVFSTYLRDAVNPTLVKQTGIVLKNNEQGEIRLLLTPASMGKVRIKLELHADHIDGRILVDNQGAKAAFQHNLPDLQRALRDGGFNIGSFNVAVGGEKQDDGEKPRRQATALLSPGKMEEISVSAPGLSRYEEISAMVNLVV